MEDYVANYAEQLKNIWKQYELAGHTSPVSAREVARWAIANNLWRPKPSDVESQCAEELAKAAREEYRINELGQRYRARHAVRVERNGKQLNLWADIDKAPRNYMEKAFAQRRRQILGDCVQLKVDIDHYNKSNCNEKPIQVVFNFTEDLAEHESVSVSALS